MVYTSVFCYPPLAGVAGTSSPGSKTLSWLLWSGFRRHNVPISRVKCMCHHLLVHTVSCSECLVFNSMVPVPSPSICGNRWGRSWGLGCSTILIGMEMKVMIPSGGSNGVSMSYRQRLVPSIWYTTSTHVSWEERLITNVTGLNLISSFLILVLFLIKMIPLFNTNLVHLILLSCHRTFHIPNIFDVTIHSSYPLVTL